MPPVGGLDPNKLPVRWQVSGMAEIGNDNASAIVEGGHEYIIRLQITVNDVTAVEVLNAHQQLSDYYRCLDVIETSSFELHIRKQISTCNEVLENITIN